MTTATRGSRLSNFGMAKGNDTTPQQLGNTFPSTSTWSTPSRSGIWGNGSIGSFAKPREAAGSKDSNDAFSKGSSGSSALAATSEVDTWVSRPGPWNSSEATQNRNVSGNTSPNRSRVDAPIHDLNGSFYSGPPSSIQAAIGQRGPGRAKPGATVDSSGGPFARSQLAADYMGDSEDSDNFGPLKFSPEATGLNGYSGGKRPSQDMAFARDPGMPTSSHSEADLHTQAHTFGELGYGPQTHSQRPSMSSFSQAGRMYNGLGQQLDRDEMQARFPTPSLVDVPGSISSSLANLSFGNVPSQSQFNPLSQPWGAGGQGLSAEYQKEMYQNSIGFEKRGSIAGRSSPAGSTYRPGLSSPKSYTGTPHQASEPWSRPASRDPRNGPEIERRGHAQQFMAQPPPGYYHGAYWNPGFGPYNPQFAYDAYSGNFRGPMPMPHGYGMPYIPGAPGMPPLRPGKDQDPARGMRSQLLDDFRSTSKSNKRFELKSIYGHIVEFSGDQHGSRFIQEKLETANSDEKDQVFREIEPNAQQLMRDVFGNYVIQKFFEHGNQLQKKVLAGVMKGKVIDLSLQMYACRVVQKALEHVLVEQQAELVKELEVDILKVVKDQNGNHVVQKIIELVPRQHIDFIINCLKGRVSELSSHTYGCRVIQRVLEYGSEADKAAIMAELHQCAPMLITDQYGNYVTQHVIQHGKPEDRSKIIGIVTRDLLLFSKHKFASNVVEKCISRNAGRRSLGGPNPACSYNGAK